jgi:predicted small lipoprotein YifL
MTRAARAPLLAATLLALAACGIRTDPRPPEDTMARAPTKLTAMRAGTTVVVEWRSPGESVDGKRLIDLARFVVERRVGDEPFAPVGETAADTTHRLRPVRQYTFVDEAPLGDDAEYRVVSYTADGQRGVPSEPARATTAAAAPAESR